MGLGEIIINPSSTEKKLKKRDYASCRMANLGDVLLDHDPGNLIQGVKNPA